MEEVDLSQVYRREGITPNEAKVIEILDEGLHSSHDNAVAKLTDDLREFFILAVPEDIAADLLFYLWSKVMHIVYILPSSEHPWLDVLAAVIHGLRRQGGPVTRLQNNLQWQDLPGFYILATDKHFPVDAYFDTEIKDWKMFNSFSCRLLTDDCKYLFLFLPYSAMTEALEETAAGHQTKFDCKVWIAAEWLIRCGNLLHRELGAGEFLTAADQAMSNVKPGPLAEGVLPISLKRWNFWRSRLVELSCAKPLFGSGEEFVLSDTTLAHVKKAICAMDSVN
ncbi:hypothetical protein N7488_011018 [Penicillium malachiteum]|nr:hypothetical protein N7488_011018 [Penicillium malachiteum]